MRLVRLLSISAIIYSSYLIYLIVWPYVTKKSPGGEEETLLQTAAGADLLILDDLGTEFNSNFFLSTLYSLLNNRLGAHLPTIVTTNITDGALLEKLYTEKISSRLSAFVPCLFAGQDIRSQKAQEV